MSVFSKQELQTRLRLDPWDPKGLIITPLLGSWDEAFDRDSVDLRLGSRFLLPKLLQ